ncbi:uncharacterized protein LOC115671680 [Syzygium oleosum]|uniref:uncharacterized protein LOC115671680 n=1 Tax=Syzygium oleosum TaxID=219896 RepID=UPI0024BA235F|nr:uncharacterized protein LOC115671680 [Syzygium oleosum]
MPTKSPRLQFEIISRELDVFILPPISQICPPSPQFFSLSLCYSSEPPPLRQTPLRRSLLPSASHDGHPHRHRRCLLLRRHPLVSRPQALPRAPPGSGAPSPRAPRSPSRTEFVSPSHLELWSSSQHRVRLGKYKRDADSLRREGENSQAVWSPDAKLIAVVTTSLYLHLFKVHFSEKRVQIGGKQPSGLYFATISLLLSEQVPFGDMNLSVSNIVSDNRHMLLGLSDGSLYGISWKGEFCGAVGLDHPIRNESDKVTDLPHPVSNGIGYSLHREMEMMFVSL